ncbi:MAG TPA: glycosyl hydrolase, partial [Solirubrobacteraceae bacterium]
MSGPLARPLGLLGLLAAMITFALAAPATGLAASSAVAIGVNVENGPGDGKALDAWKQTVGRDPAVVMWYQSFAEPLFYSTQLPDVAKRGAVPLITWMPQQGATGVPLTDIAAGKWDAYLVDSAKQAKAWGKPIMIRFGHEMNLAGAPYGPGRQGNSAALFVSAWRHVVQVFRTAGATNVRWVWTPNVDCDGKCPFTAFYPGDAYVDWVGLDGYNTGSMPDSPGWRSLASVFGSSYDQLTRLTTKPVMIAETASTEGGGDKAAWIRNAFATDLPQRLPKVRLVVWFDRRKETDWRVDSSAASLAAFKQAMAAAASFAVDPSVVQAAAPAPAPAVAPATSTTAPASTGARTTAPALVVAPLTTASAKLRTRGRASRPRLRVGSVRLARGGR